MIGQNLHVFVVEGTFQHITSGIDVYRASRDAAAWDFPRAITPAELIHGAWFRGPGVVCWFEKYAISSTCFVHLAVSPERRRGRWPVRAWLRFIERYAQGVGATELGFAPCAGCDEPERLLRRLGWYSTEYGLAMPLAHAEAA